MSAFALRTRAARAWLQQRWRLCLLGALLLLLLVSAVLRFGAFDPYSATQLQQQSILASVRCACHLEKGQRYRAFLTLFSGQ